MFCTKLSIHYSSNFYDLYPGRMLRLDYFIAQIKDCNAFGYSCESAATIEEHDGDLQIEATIVS
jgi:hypothetical protein